MFINLRNVLHVTDAGHHQVSITLETQPLEQLESETLERLFPHTFGRIERLLAIEALLASVIHGERSEPHKKVR